jgi:hypothetical protein|tara:strand:+ start:26252 stop:26794 length:543 start_codon:yes stop_codon:yes gene_type:complete
MTIRIAIFLFLASFASITCWLLCREPASPRSVVAALTVPQAENITTPTDNPKAVVKTKTQDDDIALSDTELYIKKKLSIVIPRVDFENTTIEEALGFLGLRARELDPEEHDSRKGVSFVVRKPNVEINPDSELELTIDSPRVNLQDENLTIKDILDHICAETGLRWKITDHGVLIEPHES